MLKFYIYIEFRSGGKDVKYDFETLVSRKNVGSFKWDAIKNINENVCDDIVPFSVADMEFKNAPEIMEGLKKYIDSSILGYTGPTKRYYEAICNWMERRHNWKINKEWIIEFHGVVPALHTIVQALTNEGDGVIVMAPVYYPFYKSITNHNRKIIKTELILNDNRYEINFNDLLEKAKDPNTKMIILCNPHNPVGRVWSEEELRKIGEICIANNVIVVSDEIHFDLIMPGYKHTIFSNICEEFRDISITCTAPSKTFNLAGLQTSNIIIANPEIRDKVKNIHEKNGNFSLNIFGYKACEIAYNKCEEWVDQLIKVLSINKKLAEDFIKINIPEVKIIPLEGTYLQWLDFRELESDYKKLEKFMQNEAQLFLDEGYVFGEEGEGFERINLACPTKVLEDALNRLLEAVKRVYR